VRRHLLFGLTLIACVLLVIAEFGDLNEIRIGAVVRAGQGVGDNHGHALLIVAAVAAVMALGAWRTGSRPAAIAVAVLGAVAVFVVLAVDGPDVDQTGVFGRNYEDVEAGAADGFRIAAVGAVLLLFAGVMTVLNRVAAREPAP
jgi:hypothetical protein